MKTGRRRLRLFLPVRRRLMALAVAHLFGIYLARCFALEQMYTGILCAFLLAWMLVRVRRRKSALFCLMGLVLLTGNYRAGMELARRDLPTQPGVYIEGTVSAIKKDYRVYLRDVRIDAEPAFERDVLVTLMIDEEETQDAAPVCVGQRINGTGRLFAQEEMRNPGGADQRIAALCSGYELSGYILPGWTVQGSPRVSIREALRQCRESMMTRIASLFGDHAALFRGIILGERAELDKDLVAALRLTGTAHILTVSGLHLSLIAAALSWLLRKTPIAGALRVMVLGVLVVSFTGVTGCAPGTVRACIMTMMREMARLRGKAYDPLTALSAALLGMTMVCPLLALNASFQFSFFVVMGILLLMHGVRSAMRRFVFGPGWMRRLWDMAALSMSAQIAALPMQLLFYGYVPLLALPMNILCGVFMPFALLGGLSCLLISALLPQAAVALADLLCYAAGIFEWMSLSAASQEWAILRLPSPFGICVLLFAAAMMLLSRRIAFGRARKAVLLSTLLLMIFSYIPRFCPAARYVQLDVGQGDAAVIRRGRRAVLVDVGPSGSYDMLRYLRHEGLFVEAVILSHLDEDHAGALRLLLDSEVEIPKVIMADGAMDKDVSIAVEEALDLALEMETGFHILSAGDSISVFGMTMEVLSPTVGLVGSNERSLVLHAQLEGTSLLLTGDLPADCEPAILPDCDVLKVAHHGSKYATSDVFVNMTQPELALISVGAGNRYGHPGERVLRSLERVGAKILRTDESGCITLWIGDGRIKADCFLDR